MKNKETVSGANTTKKNIKKIKMKKKEIKKRLRYEEMENELIKKIDNLVRERIEHENKR